MIVSILQPSYLPWAGVFDLMLRSDCFVYHDNLAYDKSWRNRNRIRTQKGFSWLTVPVKGKALSSMLLTEVEIDNKRQWARRQWNLIQENYRSASCFRDYGSELEEILCGREWKGLLSLNCATTEWILRCLDLKPRILFASDLSLGDSQKNERIVRICQSLKADTWLANEACRGYVEPEAYERAGIRVVYQDYVHPVYPQVFDPFLSHLSVIDLLFNCGSESLAVIRKGGSPIESA